MKVKTQNLIAKLGIIGTGVLCTGIIAFNYYVKRFNPPEWYRQEFEHISRCLNKDSDFPSRFYSIKGDDFPCHVGRCVGMYLPKYNTVLVSESKRGDLYTIRHELEHANGVEEDSIDTVMRRCYSGI